MSDEEKPSYYSILTADVRYDESLKPNEKILFSEITALTNKDGKCWASNSYFAKLYGVSKITISVWINSLIEHGYLKSTIVYKEGTKEILNRYLEISKEGYIEKTKYPINENLKDNNTSINNTSINKDIVEIINYLNEKAHKKYKPVQSNAKFIHQRLSEGFTIEDFKKVIDNKCSDWLDDEKMNQYLRPQTLFIPNNFQSYLNQSPKQPKKGKETVPKYVDMFAEMENL